MKILWANLHCLVDQTSGASMSVRTMLKQLHSRGHIIKIIGASNFDRPNDANKIVDYFQTKREKKILKLDDDGLSHIIVRSVTGRVKLMTSEELWDWTYLTESALDEFSPDVVLFYGAKTAEQWLARECLIRGVPTAKYLVNENYTYKNFAKRITGLFTDTRFTADLYQERYGLNVNPVGKFIAPSVIADSRQPKFLTMINPSPEKGCVLAVQVTAALHRAGHNVPVQFVDSRGTFEQAKQKAIEAGVDVSGIKDTLVLAKPGTEHVSQIYQSTKVLFVPSLWQESGARVIAESMLNGIPVVASNRGGNAEMVGDGGYIFEVPLEICEKPYDKAVPSDVIEDLSAVIDRLFGESAYYEALSASVEKEAYKHDIEKNTDRLEAFLSGLIKTGVDRKEPETDVSFGSPQWLVQREWHYGGLQRGVIRRVTSASDPRPPEQYTAGYIEENGQKLPLHIGGDRMAPEKHNYAPAYSSFLKPYYSRESTSDLTIVEVGILRGHGLAIWCDLFPDARVIGLDLDPDIFSQWRPVLEQRGAFQENAPEVYAFDQFDPDTALLSQIAADGKIDVFIDDGAHTREAILDTLDAVKGHMSERAVYIIEDFRGIDTEVRERLPDGEFKVAVL